MKLQPTLPPTIKNSEKAFLFDVPVDMLTLEALHGRLQAYIEEDQKALVPHVNVHGLNLAYSRPWLRRFFNTADTVFCDGAGVILGARLLGKHIPARITYADWMWQLAAFAAPRSYTFYFLGASPGIPQQAADKMRRRHPDLRIVGTHHGYFNKTAGHPENTAVIADINRHRPNILIVGMGMPLQEKWLMENWSQIDANIALTGGAVFDYISGNLQRAPKWMTDNSLEWLGRLLIEPGRLWQRYILGNPVFIARILRQRFFGLPKHFKSV